jgi:hypothetical protein
MTKDEALRMAKAWFEHNTYGDEAVEVYEAIEQALAAPVQEPVAWYRDEDGIRIYYESKVWDDATPLYTTPPAAQPNERDIRNAALDEIAGKIALMPFGDTAASFAVWIKEQKT